MMDVLNDSLEDFYGDPQWLERRNAYPDREGIMHCGVSRVPGGRVFCHNELGHHERYHRGIDAAGRVHTWSTVDRNQ